MDLRVIPYLKTEILDSGENLASTSRENHLSKCIKQGSYTFHCTYVPVDKQLPTNYCTPVGRVCILQSAYSEYE